MKEMDKLFRQVPVIDRLPIEDKEYDTDLGKLEFFTHWKAWRFDKKPKWWLEEVELPSEEEIDIKGHNEAWTLDNGLEENNMYSKGFMSGANYILNTLKGTEK